MHKHKILHLFRASDDEVAPRVQRALSQLSQLRLVLAMQHAPMHTQTEACIQAIVALSHIALVLALIQCTLMYCLIEN